ncbi:permease-like cell division protein FtsX [Ruminococcus sp.]|uniref:permease-like cell division protein FtsX n=1 Tax=Ruminococcus sp. TaxID=41978 RepID=UPI0025F89F99|nr:permease-like cell division protein FtsX [Ruminococcus sp.]MBQ6251811.1 permease-like cell division protein FtsX [Ruminococcus sp.]MBR3665689.1 permease-like cell division protein FtsX [Ruminococcus sp.]MBR6994399.1 permease-like cell division protein FtsX [Ruminococcus sp.]
MKLSGIKYLANQGVENIWKNKMMAFATFCVLLISLLLVGIAGLFYINLNSMIKGLGSQNEVVVLMNVGTTAEQNTAAEAAIKELPNIDKVTFISKEDALSRQRANLPNAEKIFDEYIGSDASFMPDGFSVTVKDTDLITETTEKISAIANIQSASASPQVAEFLRELRKVVSLIAGAIIIALAVVSMIIISNTTKASVFARREEIQIMKYVGATNAFIRMPFFVEGMVTGLFAGAGAYFITWAVYRAVYNMITEQGMLMNTFGVKSLIPFSDIRLPLALAYLVVGALIGALGSVVSTRKHIDV